MELVSLLCPNCRKELKRNIIDVFLCTSCGQYSIINEGRLSLLHPFWVKEETDSKDQIYYASLLEIPLGVNKSLAIPLNIHPYNIKIIVKFSNQIFPFDIDFETTSPSPDAIYFEPHLSLSGIWSIIPLILELNDHEDTLLDFNPSSWKVIYFPCTEREDGYYNSLLPWQLTRTLISKDLSLKTAIYQSTIDRELLRQHWQEVVEVEEKKPLMELFD